MSTFTLSFDMNGKVFEESGVAEIQRILTKLSDKLERSPEEESGSIMDLNGNTVGEWEITTEAPHEPQPWEATGDLGHSIIGWSHPKEQS